jgi:hypothetical protein
MSKVFDLYQTAATLLAGETTGRLRGGNVLLFPLPPHALPNDKSKRNDAQNYK